MDYCCVEKNKPKKTRHRGTFNLRIPLGATSTQRFASLFISSNGGCGTFFALWPQLPHTPSHSLEEARARMSNAECFPPKLKACLLFSEHRPGVCHPALRGGREQDKCRHLLLHLLHPGWPPRGGAWELPHQEGGQRTAGERGWEAYLFVFCFLFFNVTMLFCTRLSQSQ